MYRNTIQNQRFLFNLILALDPSSRPSFEPDLRNFEVLLEKLSRDRNFLFCTNHPLFSPCFFGLLSFHYFYMMKIHGPNTLSQGREPLQDEFKPTCSDTAHKKRSSKPKPTFKAQDDYVTTDSNHLLEDEFIEETSFGETKTDPQYLASSWNTRISLLNHPKEECEFEEEFEDSHSTMLDEEEESNSSEPEFQQPALQEFPHWWGNEDQGSIFSSIPPSF